ncbi:gasdermin-E-like [Gouania willdenowi]|uniref:Gasdermin-E-like n=1 Tax=Gouania willdenowi TaxID=441366 RepID=A0A8C5ENQ9_GOUWI|nr:gasdermin-E-like [Gouania willdenowi]XP_028317474.1 gasdermin-E-like [Gouania willdenowi]
MFSKATSNFVRQIDPEGSLIHVSRVNDSQKLVPMAIVVKRDRIWFWQRPKYQPTDFTLADLLSGDAVLSPGVSEKDFLTYEGMFGDKLTGKLDSEIGSVSVVVEGKGSSKLYSGFGQLKKEELDVKKLLRDSSNRLVDMHHVLVQQLKKRAEVLAVVKERILTTNTCSVSQTKKEQCSFQGVLWMLGLLGGSFKVQVKDTNSIEMDSDVSLEIPPGTVVAFSVLELEIKKNGHYAICLQPGTVGGFESDSPIGSFPSIDSLTVVDGTSNGHSSEKLPLNALLNGSQEMDLSPLSELPQSTRCVFIKHLQETMKDRSALTYLQDVLEEVCGGETFTEDEKDDVSESGRATLSAILDRPGSDQHSAHTQCTFPAYLSAAHLLVSAIEELPDQTLSLLGDSRPDFLEAFDALMCRFKENSEPLSVQDLPGVLQDSQSFQLVEQVLYSVKVKLRRDAVCLWAETDNNAGVLPLVLCLSVHGLALLCHGMN